MRDHPGPSRSLRWPAAEHEVDLMVAGQPQRALPVSHLEEYADGRMLRPEGGEQPRQQLLAGRSDGGDAQQAALGLTRGSGMRLVEEPEHAAHISGVDSARVGQPEAAAVLAHQRQLEVFLQRAYAG